MIIDELIESAEEKSRVHEYHADLFENGNPMRDACLKSSQDCKQLAEWLKQLKEYQQLEADGRLIKLPCKVGDTIYFNGNSILEYDVECFSVDETGVFLIHGMHYVSEYNKTFRTNFVVDDIGKTLFLTREEAEAKLKELRGDNND